MKWTVPISPVAASRPRVSKYGSYYVGPYKDFKKDAEPILREVLGDWKPTEKNLSVKIVLHPEKPKTSKLDYPKPDVDNYIKAVLDLCNDIVWVDDAQILTVTATKAWSKGKGYFTIEIKEIT